MIRAAGVRPTALWVTALVAYAVLSLWLLPETNTFPSPGDRVVSHIGYGMIALLMLLATVFGTSSRGLAPRLLTHPIVAWLGLISYGIFLWHYVFTLEFGFPGQGWGFGAVLLATLALTTPIAAASYYLVERPILRFKYRRWGSFRALWSGRANRA